MVTMAYASFRTHKIFSMQRMGILLLLTVLYLVATSGWFFSPFFFLLYLASIGISFFYGQAAATIFTFTLVALFSLNIGEVDITYDFLVLLSLLSVLPLNIFLKKYFLSFKEQQKDILVLKRDGSKHSGSNVAELLANKVNNMSAYLREDINDIKQLAYAAEKLTSKDDQKKNNERIRTSAEKALRILNDFEQEVTGTTVKSNL
jgi:glucan phosphoethanolaminetransferase (alkaline phosphatase superfamily)